MEQEHRANLRLSVGTYEAIEALRKRLLGNVSRNSWIALAVQEKIDRDAATDDGEDLECGDV